jgi:ATPase subunit of ABC transporter with duplicated ATPase domains
LVQPLTYSAAIPSPYLHYPAGIFDQDLAQELPLDQTALDYVSQVARITDPSLTLEKVRAALGALGLTGSLPLQQIGSLSGGEKARVALAVFALVPANVLLLDEASNHLDAATLEVLTGGQWIRFLVCCGPGHVSP